MAAPDGAALVAGVEFVGTGTTGVDWIPVVADKMRYISALAVSLKNPKIIDNVCSLKNNQRMPSLGSWGYPAPAALAFASAIYYLFWSFF